MSSQKDYTQEAEELAKSDPELLLEKIKGIALRSKIYCVFLLVVGLVATLWSIYLLFTGEGFLFLIFIPAALTYSVGRGIFYSEPKIIGYKLEESDKTKAFFALLHDLEEKIQVKIHEVYIDGSCNAGVVEISKLGFLGGYVNTLIIGLPLLSWLSENEFKGVLAHELGHISNRDSSEASIGRKTRASWIRILHTISTTSYSRYTAPLITWYLNREWPKLDAYTFALNRLTEYRADSFAQKYASADAFASGLLKVSMLNQLWNSYTIEYSKQYLQGKSENLALYAGFESKTKEPISDDTFLYWINLTLFKAEGKTDTHPIFRKRLEALGIHADLDTLLAMAQKDTGVSAARYYLTDILPELIAFNDHKSQAKFTEMHTKNEKHKELIKAGKNSFDADLDSAINKTRSTTLLIYNVEGREAAQPYITKLLQKDPEDSMGMYLTGKMQLEDLDPEGESKYKKLLSEKKASFKDIYNDLYKFYAKKGLQDKIVSLDNATKGGVWV